MEKLFLKLRINCMGGVVRVKNCAFYRFRLLEKKSLNFFCIFVSFLCVSCSSVPKFLGEAKMCCMVLNEKNEPVNECVGILKKNGVVIGKNISDEKGYLFFDNVKSGDYEVLIRKEGFEEKKYDKVSFYNRGKIICFQVKSKDCLFDEIELLINEKKYEEAIAVLGTVCFSKNSCVEVLVKLYKLYAYLSLGEKKLAAIEFYGLKKIEREIGKVLFDYSYFEYILEAL